MYDIIQMDLNQHVRVRKKVARHYSTKSFFRQMPNALLARYFKRNGLFTRYRLRRHEGRQAR